MSAWLNAALLAAAINVVLLLALGGIWLRNYRRYRASHTLGLLIFAAVLLVQNLLWLYFYGLHPGFIGWFLNTGTDVQIGLMALCGLETLALVVLFRITWQ